MITTLRLGNTFINSCNYLFLVVRTFKIFSLSNFQVYNTVLNIVTMFPDGSDVKEYVCNAGDPDSIPGLGSTLEKEMTTHSSILAFRIPWREEPGGL